MAERSKPLSPIQRYWLEGEQPWENDVVRWTALEQKMAAWSARVTEHGQQAERHRDEDDIQRQADRADGRTH
jgi:hypothetical protein